jgi:hypothetical protein
MSAYPLETASALRKRQQQAALRRLEEARAALRAAEERAERRRSEREKARAALEAARLRPTPDPLTATKSGREEADCDRYLGRLRDDHRRASAAFDAFTARPLQQARGAEEDAQRAYTEARRACEALERHEDNFRQEERRQRERRHDEEAEEAARAARHHRAR